METHIEGTVYGDPYIGYNVWRLIQSTMYGDNIEGTMYGDSYRCYNVWRLV